MLVLHNPTMILLGSVLYACTVGAMGLLLYPPGFNNPTVCPWEDPLLEKWSEPQTWPSGKVPQENDIVIIPTGKRVILDAPIPRLLSLTIDGVLVWGDVDNVRMETSYILVNGEFHIGSEDCKFQKKADIFLHGKSNSREVVEAFGRKFIGTTQGSKLEIHGKKKRGWTKLVATVEPGSQPLYDAKKKDMNGKPGIWVNVWSPWGMSLGFFTYTLEKSNARIRRNLVNRLKRIPEGNIVALGVYKSIGEASDRHNELYQVIEGLGGAHIRDVGENEPYVLISQIGKPESAVEGHTKGDGKSDGELEAAVTYPLGALAFKARSYSDKANGKDDVDLQMFLRDAAFPKLSLLHDVTSWQPGDEVVVASTDFDWRQYEVKTIVPCSDCGPNQIRVDGGFEHMHFGEVTYGVDERAEVGLLSRNIRIEAELQKDCYSYTDHEKYLCSLLHRDTFGGHVMVRLGSWARIEGVELYHMGQQSLLARYPIHFHLCDDVPGQYLRDNVVRDSNSRCFTIHGTNYLDASGNVCLNHLGHGVFVEDSVEQNNTVRNNLVIGTTHGTLLMTDMSNEWCPDREYCGLLASYWITHPNNVFTDNVAAGSDGSGMVLSFADRPLGPSLQRMKDKGLYEEFSTRYTKIGEFARNTMHSNRVNGLWFDSRISSGEMDNNKFIPENAILGISMYSPRVPPNPRGRPVESVLSGLTMYKNEGRNSWIRCGNIVITNSSFADSPASYVAAHTMEGTYCDVRDSIFIGETANKGKPFTYTFNDKQFHHLPKSERPHHTFDRSIAEGHPDFMISGVQFYQGPVYLHNCYFDKFENWFYNDSFIKTWGFRPMRPAAAITFHPNNHYPMIPTNGVENLKFGFCDGKHNSFKVMDGNASTPGWTEFDGTGNVMFRDYDGSLTGRKDAQIVQDRPFFTGPRCLKKPDWGLSVCPYKYFMLVVRGKTGALKGRYKGQTPVLIRRDDVPEDVYSQTGKTAHKFTLRVFKSYTVFFNSSVADAPRDVQFRPRYGLENNEVVRFAVCLPKSTTNFTIYSEYPQLHPKKNLLPLWVNNIKQLDRDKTMKAFYWDKANGYLYFKMKSPHSLTGLGQVCPGDVCLDVNIKRDDGDDEPAVCDAPVKPFNIKDRSRRVRKSRCTGPDSPEDLGAPIETDYLPLILSAPSDTCA
ncbi:hypothetical protein EGW08_016453 [Elysia chlorotica]|uniref:G8 domain-containing protein n=1 Tax=Elysia chlorotica TaxID=188477 RepID=A0A3S1HB92_ELYCH|nr:hypothetical protein EGW08_016453 [Elysia chlorotica]